jgi:hypothetical protein
MEELDAAYCDDVGLIGDDKGVKSPLVASSCWREGVEAARPGAGASPGPPWLTCHDPGGATHIGDLAQGPRGPARDPCRGCRLGRLGLAHPLALCDAVWYVEEEGAHQGGD